MHDTCGGLEYRVGAWRPVYRFATSSLFLALFGAHDAFAQSGVPFDANGPDVPPAGDSPLLLWSAEAMQEREARFSLLAEVGTGLLQREQGGEVVDLLPVAAGANLSAGYAPTSWLGLGVSATVWPVAGGGPGLGNVRFDASVPVVRGESVQLAIHPWGALPSGTRNRGVATAGPEAGIVAALGGSAGLIRATGNVGLAARRGVEIPPGPSATQRIGGPSFDFGAALGLRSGSYLLDAEFRGAWSFTAGVIADDASAPAANLFGEAVLSGGVALGERTMLRAGAGSGVTRGIGSPVLRAFAGVTWRDRPSQVAKPKVVDLPAVDRPWRFDVTADGEALAGAVVRLGGVEVGRTNAEGKADFTSLDWEAGVTVDAPGFELQRATPPPSGQRVLVELVAEHVQVRVRVQDERGSRLGAEVVATNAEGESVTADGGVLRLAPDTWEVEISGEGRGTQKRTLAVVAGLEPEPIDVVLLEAAGAVGLVHTVLDAEGAPVVGATVRIDGLPVGTTGADGTVVIAGLAAGDHQLTIEHQSYTSTEQSVHFEDGEATIDTQLARVPGTVKVVALNGEGQPVLDAVVRFSGPRRLAPMPLGSRGERTQVLGPGTWQLLVSSTQYGFQQREIEVSSESHERILVEVVLQLGEGGLSSLDIRVVDPDGNPLDGIDVQLDGQSYGSTSTGGRLLLEELNAGQRDLEVHSPRHLALDPVPLVLLKGLQDELITLPWRPGAVRVTARTPSGPLGDASVRFSGGARIKPASLGPMGRGFFELDTGAWSALVTSPSLGLQQRDFAVVAEVGRVVDLDMVLSEPEGGMANLEIEVLDPDGQPIDHADVLLDGVPFGATAGGVLRVDQLGTGRRSLDILAPFFRPHQSSIQLMEGDSRETITLDWAPRTVRVEVADAEGAPVRDAVLRLLGPHGVPPSPVDGEGRRLFELSAGPWQALAISPTLGMTEVSLVVTENEEGLLVVPITLRPVQAGRAELVLRVVDSQGGPVGGASVTVDGEERGDTAVGGVLLLDDLLPGVATVALTAPGHRATNTEVELLEGSQVRYVEMVARPGVLTVSVSNGDGAPVDAEVSLLGPNDWLPMPVGPDGVEAFVVDPGRWEVIAQAPGLGAARAVVVVSAAGQARVSLELRPSQVEITDFEVVIRDVVLFDFGAATLRSDAADLLDEVANTLASYPEIIRVEVQGHSDSVGDLVFNQTLSQQRAESVREALITRGIPPEKLTYRGYGAQRPVADNESEQGRAENRRVEFEIQE